MRIKPIFSHRQYRRLGIAGLERQYGKVDQTQWWFPLQCRRKRTKLCCYLGMLKVRLGGNGWPLICLSALLVWEAWLYLRFLKKF